MQKNEVFQKYITEFTTEIYISLPYYHATVGMSIKGKYIHSNSDKLKLCTPPLWLQGFVVNYLYSYMLFASAYSTGLPNLTVTGVWVFTFLFFYYIFLNIVYTVNGSVKQILKIKCTVCNLV